MVWVANMNNPLNDTSGIMNISQDGNLVILNGKKIQLVGKYMNLEDALISMSGEVHEFGRCINLLGS